jgi:hypothetical protein
MKKVKRLNLGGELNAEMTELPSGMQSTNAASLSTGAMSEKTHAVESQIGSLHISNSREIHNATLGKPSPNAIIPNAVEMAQIISAMASKLGTLVNWRKIRLRNGDTVWALTFNTTVWRLDDRCSLVLR